MNAVIAPKVEQLRAGLRQQLVDLSAAHLDERTWADELADWTPPAALASPDVPVEFVVEGLIAKRKVGVLVAGGGTGKTTLQISLMVCGAVGREFMGLAVAEGTYVMLSSDDPQEDLDAALARIVRAMHLSAAEIELVRRRVRLHSLQGKDGTKTFSAPVDGNPTSTGMVDIVLRALARISDLRMLFFDTLRQYSGGNSNDEQVVKLAIADATQIAQCLGCAVMFAHHTGKQNYRDKIDDMYAGSGSAAIADNSRFVLVLQTATWPDIEEKVRRTGQERGEPLVLTSSRGSLLVRPPPPIYMCRDGFLIERVKGPLRTLEQIFDEKDRDILRAVQRGLQSKNEIFSAVGGKRALVLKRVDDLLARGHLLDKPSTSSQGGTRARLQFVLSTTGSKLLNDAL